MCERTRSTGQRLLDQVLTVEKPSGREAALHIGIGDEPWRENIELARREGCDLIVMTSHGRGELAAAVLGSQTASVLAHAEIMVLVPR